MPSEDPRLRLALTALARPIAEFRAAIHGALDRAEAVLAAATADPASRAARCRAELGVFAEGRISPEALAAVAAPVTPADPAAVSALHDALELLRRVEQRGESCFVATVPTGGDLGQVVSLVLAETACAFGAAALVELVRGGRYQAERHAALLKPVSFRAWSKAERRIVPPLVVSVEGADLHAGALADFCDGRAKLVLVVRGPCAPAALVRLITPGTLVLQTVDGSGLQRVADCEGPAIAALVPEGAAQFLHDPTQGSEPWQRLSVNELPAAPRHRLGGVSAWQLAEDLRQLATLARTPFAIAGQGQAPAPAVGSSDAVDRLAAWLLEAGGRDA